MFWKIHIPNSFHRATLKNMGLIWSMLPTRKDVLSHPPNYTGTWQSTDIPGVKGTIEAVLPFSPPSPPSPGKEYLIDMLVTYDMTSPFKPGWQVLMKTRGTVNQTSSGTASIAHPSRFPVLTKQSLTIVSEDQKIGYQVQELTNLMTIQGEYISISPSDKGHFELEWSQH